LRSKPSAHVLQARPHIVFYRVETTEARYSPTLALYSLCPRNSRSNRTLSLQEKATDSHPLLESCRFACPQQRSQPRLKREELRTSFTFARLGRGGEGGSPAACLYNDGARPSAQEARRRDRDLVLYPIPLSLSIALLPHLALSTLAIKPGGRPGAEHHSDDLPPCGQSLLVMRSRPITRRGPHPVVATVPHETHLWGTVETLVNQNWR
jgi:hypothetical protein